MEWDLKLVSVLKDRNVVIIRKPKIEVYSLIEEIV